MACEQPEAAVEAAGRADVDVVVHAVSGAAGLSASFAAAEAGKRICLANKESLVCGGELLLKAVEAGGAELLPIDSEHSALHQCARAGRTDEIDRLILTASGGPFRDAEAWPTERMERATVADAMNHPTWNMGGKNTLDSATLFNKALEVIEAAVLFGVPADKIDVVIHPQSVVHSMIEFRDGSTIAQLTPPDMRGPIAYALCYPHRREAGVPRLDLTAAFSLDFSPPDPERFPALTLAKQALDAGGTAPLVLNAANEVAGAAFRERQIGFNDISRVVVETMLSCGVEAAGSLRDLLDADAEARQCAQAAVERLAGATAGR